MRNITESERTFVISEEEYKKFLEWKPGVHKRAMKIQKKECANDPLAIAFPYEYCWGKGEPYYGAIGGDFTFHFTPTSIGTAVSVKECITGEEINITDYKSW